MKNTRSLSLALLCVGAVACSKSDPKQAPADPAATKPVETAPAVAPAPAPAPVQEEPGPTAEPAPKRAATAREAEALGLLRSIAEGKDVELNRVSADENDRVLVFVDLSAKPQGGRRNVQEGYCGFNSHGHDGFAKMAKLLKQRAYQIKLSLDDDLASCTTKDKDRVVCKVPATSEGDATIGFEIASNPTAIAAIYLRDTFMVEDEARLAKDEKTINAAIKQLGTETCLSNAEHDARSRAAFEDGGPALAVDYCCCKGPGLGDDGAAVARSECTAKGNSCVPANEVCEQAIHDELMTIAKGGI
jgi:hypothetical protein